MKNSDEFLSAELRGHLTPEQIRIIDGIQFGSRLTLKEKVHEAAMQMYQQNQKRNPADGGDGGNIFIAARHMRFDGKILTNGGDAALGGKPGKAGGITLVSETMEGKPTIEAKGGKVAAAQKPTPWHKRWWGILIEIAAVVSAIFTVLQFFKHS